MRTRTVELTLLILASVTTIVGYGIVLFSQQLAENSDVIPQLQGQVGAFLLVIVVLMLSTHAAIRWLAPLADGMLFPLAALLNGLGYVMIARLDEGLADSQAAWTFIGLIAFIGVLFVLTDPRILEPYPYLLALGGVVLLLLPLIPKLGVNINGARIWLRVFGLSIQPGEFAKILLAAFTAGFLVEKRELLTLTGRRILFIHIPNLKHFSPLALALGAALSIMVLQRDLGSSLLLFTLFLAMIYVATSRAAYVILGMLGFMAGAYIAWWRFSHVQRRVQIWVDPFEDPQGAGFQIVEATFAMADGGLTGTGLGQGTPKKITYAATDMIFAAFGEELGLLGTTAIIVTFIFLIGAGFRIATNARSAFEKLLATGLTTLLGIQAIIIIGGIIRVLPLTGVTLPFVSYGGSSLLSNYIILAILIRISHNSVVQASEEKADINRSTGVSVSSQARAGWKALDR